MKSRVGIALVLLGIAAVTGAGGGSLIGHAVSMPAPDSRRPREVPGLVVEIDVVRCSQRRHTRTCFMPVVSYTDASSVQQVVSRSRYSPSSPHRVGERVPVLIENDGTVWIASEWESRLRDHQRDYKKARQFPLIMGILIAACAAFALILAAGLVFFVDRSAEA